MYYSINSPKYRTRHYTYPRIRKHIKNAILVKDVFEEYKYINEHFGKYDHLILTNVKSRGKYYDHVNVELLDVRKAEFWFDISSMFEDKQYEL